MITAVMPTYGRKDVVFERGEGNYLYATDGRRYLDFTSGIAVNALGHCHPYLVKALTEQGSKLWHTSNLFRVGNGDQSTLPFGDVVAAALVDEGAITEIGRAHVNSSH